MIQFFKQPFFKFLLLILLSLKIGHFVYENVSSLHHSETISCTIDLDDFESENEEKKEFDESEKIHQTLINTAFSETAYFKLQADKLSKNYRDFYFEFTTPPPELS